MIPWIPVSPAPKKMDSLFFFVRVSLSYQRPSGNEYMNN